MNAVLHPATWVALALGLRPDHWGWLVAPYADGAWWLVLLRTVLIVGGRYTGLYHPAFYRWWPRLPWRVPVRLWLIVARWYERVFVIGERATGGFAGVLQTLAHLYRPGHVLLGRAQGWGIGLLQPVGLPVERHLFMLAMTGAGKTVALVTILSTWTGSAFVIDPKGQITAALRGHDWRRWYVLDPFSISGSESASFNAFDCLKEAVARSGAHEAVLWSWRIAEALVITPPGSRTPYFTEVARAFLASLILFVFKVHPPSDHHLPFVRDLLVLGYRVYNDDGTERTKAGEARALLLDAMLRNDAFDGAIAGGAAAIASAGDETAGNVWSTLLEQTKLFDLPQVRDISRTTSAPWSDLKTRGDVVWSVVAPILAIRGVLSGWCRMLTNLSAFTFETVKEKKGQCLCIIDELPSQGHNATFEVMLAVARSYGQTVLGISQNIELLKQAYPNSWGTFIGEADAVFWMATNHQETAFHLSQVLGRRTLTDRDPKTRRKSYRDVPAMDPDQVKRYLAPGSGSLIVSRAGERALKLKNEPYFEALPVWDYAPDPAYQETLMRRLTRRLLARAKRARRAVSVSPS